MDKIKFAIAAKSLRTVTGLSQTEFAAFMEKEYATLRVADPAVPGHKVQVTWSMVVQAEAGNASAWTGNIYQRALGLDEAAIAQLGKLQDPGEPFEEGDVKDPSTLVELALRAQLVRHAMGIGPRLNIRFK